MAVSVLPLQPGHRHGRGALRLRRVTVETETAERDVDDPGVEPTLHLTPGAGGRAGGITDIPQLQFSVTYALTTDRRR
jgi:hypothetical protein